MNKKILIIDDDNVQVKALSKTVSEIYLDASIESAFEELDIIHKVQNSFYNLVILDIRMDKYDINGIKVAEMIVEYNPFAKILFVSAYIDEFASQINSLIMDGKVAGFSKKQDYNNWKPELESLINSYYDSLDNQSTEVNNALIEYYANVKNEPNIFKKGNQFEHFITLLFNSIGFTQIQKRVKDKSLNEVDLIIRNDIEDPFLTKFGKYILIECKNRPDLKTNKNDFIVFQSKLANTNGLSELGFLITTSTITRNSYIEAVRTSSRKEKIVFIDNKIIHKLLTSIDFRYELKQIIDSQVKDN